VETDPTPDDAEEARPIGGAEKAKKRLIAQKQAAAEIGVNER
jgi:hypothetical protein